MSRSVAEKSRLSGGQSGFTLLEILLSFALLTIILTMAYAGLQVVHRQASQVTELEKLTSQVRIVDRLIRRQLKSALPIPLSQNDFDQKELFLKGEPDKVSFVGPLPPYAPNGGIYYQQFAIEKEGDHQSMVFRFKPKNLLTPGGGSEEQVVLIDSDSVQLAFEYRRNDSESDDQWRSIWEESESLPGLIRVRVNSTELNERLFWPDLMIAPFHGQD